MVNNFSFLRKVNSNLYEIIIEAEKLYRDEYFEQCIGQTRRFGEQVCKDILKQNNITPSSFDDMISTLKDNSNGNPQEKEFIDDLYFLKKNGNNSVHSGKIKKDSMTALECLKRSFEIAINYCVYNQGASSNILKLNYDVELLVTNKKSQSLAEKYNKAKKMNQKIQNKNLLDEDDFQEYKPNSKFKISLFGKFIIFLSVISVLIILVIWILLFFTK